MAAVFINAHYRGCSGIVTIPTPKGAIATLTAKDLHRDVRKFFNIKHQIKFYDFQTTSAIPDAILSGYVSQFRASAGWCLGIADANCKDKDYDDDDDDVDDDDSEMATNTESLRNLMNPEILRNLSDLDFKMIQAHYNNTQLLQNTQQIKLAKIIVKNILEKDMHREFLRRDFIYLSEVVCQVFKSELKEVYYSKAQKGQKASGKLHDAYANYRRLLTVSGLLKRRTYAAVTPKRQSENDAEMQDAEATTVMNYVKSNTKISTEFLEKWLKCLPERQKILTDSEMLSTGDYLKLFPILEIHKNYLLQLCLADVKALYPDFCGFEQFDNMYENILQKAANLKNSVVQKWVKASTHCCQHTKKALTFMVLPYFFPATTVKKRALKKAYRPSKMEVQEKFVLYYETMQRADSLKKYNVELNGSGAAAAAATQPIVVFVGANETLTSYVTFMENKYVFENPLEAVQSCLSLYLALRIPYPPESAFVWSFVQKYVFGVTTAGDINNSSIKSVHQQLTAKTKIASKQI